MFTEEVEKLFKTLVVVAAVVGLFQSCTNSTGYIEPTEMEERSITVLYDGIDDETVEYIVYECNPLKLNIKDSHRLAYDSIGHHPIAIMDTQWIYNKKLIDTLKTNEFPIVIDITSPYIGFSKLINNELQIMTEDNGSFIPLKLKKCYSDTIIIDR